MKLYGDFTKEDWLEAFKITEEKVPPSFILHGEWEHEWNLSTWKEILSEEQWIPIWNTIVGKYKKHQIGFANVFGGPIAAAIVHRFAVLGTETFVQTGYFGGLSHEVQYGDIFIVTSAVMEDGVSQWYVNDRKTVAADPQLVEEAIKYCEEKGYRYVTGSIFTTGAIMVETSEMVKGWAEQGHIGVDMETATTFAIAERFNRKAVGLLNLSDHIIKGDTFYSVGDSRDEQIDETDEKIREIALYLSTLKR
ncbi:phosphorylase family protein [Pseudalkalibacillus sp. Hm43]|uniref:phosphorylase family protein n=1 Tax=Pseudalkalibacillus sp. Hm43 TaxID=3450742 RepID=UPI003F420F5C